MFSKNVGTQFVVSGFAKAADASLSEYATFQLKVDIVYYQGVGKTDVIKTYTYEFLPTSDDWQFVCGSLDTDYIRVRAAEIKEAEEGEETPSLSDGNSYSCIKAIDIYCEYSDQYTGYALFDNISVVNATDYSIQKYYYYTNGLVARTEGLTYNEYYFYDTNRNLVISANNRGEVTYYFYEHETNPYVVTSSVDCDFTYNGTYDYPHQNGDSFAGLSETAKTRTDYTYEEHGLCILTKTYEATLGTDGEFYKKSGSKELTQSYSYVTYDSSNYSLEKTCFGAVLTSTDSLGVTTRNFYDVTKGRLLATVNESTGEGLAYTYDSIGNLSGVTPATFVSSSQYNSITNAESVNYTYNNQNLLSSITTESTVYTLTYDAFGNSSSVKAGDKTLATYEYNNNNGKLTKINYGNGFSVEYVYNRLEMLTEIWYNESNVRTLAYEYAYTDDGQVYKFKDNLNDRTITYRYDNVGKLVSFAEYDNDDFYHDFSAEMFYDQNTNELSSIHYKLNFVSPTPKTTNSIAYYYNRNADGVIYKNTISTKATSGREEFTYDGYDRLTGKQAYFSVSNNTSRYFDNDTTYTYKSDALTGYNTSAFVEKYTSYVNNSLSFENIYSYESDGNIAKIRYNDGTEIRYVYDNIGQLIREDNGRLGKTYLYEYDNAGNITAVKTCNLTAYGATPSVISTKNYTYSSGSWGDLLTGYNGATITYDNIGNPLIYNNGSAYTFTWSGRQLIGTVYNSNTYSFTYNENGYRTSKTKNGVTTTYHLNGSQIMAEETNGNMTVYLYDVNGSPVGMQYHAATAGEYDWQVFWYEKNLQGDVVAVYSDSGVKLVSYTYDAWGNFTTTYHNGGASTKAADNPFTYRGYYYERDLNLYYLGTRYYDSKICRFINADGYASTGQGLIGNNMFAYCGNNPVNRKDPAGHSWITALVVVAIAVISIVSISSCSNTNKVESEPLPYQTADDAAMAFANSTYDSSRYIRHEYGTVIYSKTIDGVTTYDYAAPVVGSPHSVGYGGVKIPLGTTKVATAHTHPNSNSFSGISHGATSGDIPNAIKRGLDSYVIGPNLNLQKYSISSGSISVVGTASPITLTDSQKSALVSSFKISWDNHLGTCAFGCEYMTWPTP